MVDDLAEVPAGRRFTDLVAVIVEEDLVPTRVAVDALLILEGRELGGLAGVQSIIGIAVAILGAALAIALVVHIVPAAGVGFHIVAPGGEILLDTLAIFSPEPGGAVAGELGLRTNLNLVLVENRFHNVGIITVLRIVINVLVQRAVVGVDGHDVPVVLPAGIERQVRAGHGLIQHFAGLGGAVEGSGIKIHPRPAILVHIPPLEGKACSRDGGNRRGFGRFLRKANSVRHPVVIAPRVPPLGRLIDIPPDDVMRIIVIRHQGIDEPEAVLLTDAAGRLSPILPIVADQEGAAAVRQDLHGVAFIVDAGRGGIVDVA